MDPEEILPTTAEIAGLIGYLSCISKQDQKVANTLGQVIDDYFGKEQE
jgi:hypothetical protein